MRLSNLNCNLDSLYYVLNKQLLLIESYTEIRNLIFILRSCRLKPNSYFFKKRTKNINLYTDWFDEFGNSLKINKNKKIKIINGDLSLDKSKIICTDLYYGLSLNKIIKISKFAYISCGIDEDLYQNCALISFLGIDNYFRTYLYFYGDWQQISTLTLGIKNINIIIKKLDLVCYTEVSNIVNTKLPFTQTKTWLTSLPISNEFLNILDTQCNIVSSIFKQN